jgi:SAM-dependent methyltransferase
VGYEAKVLKDGSTMSTVADRDASRTTLPGRAARLSARFRETARHEGLSTALTKAARKTWKHLNRVTLSSGNAAPAVPAGPVERDLSIHNEYRRQRAFNLANLIACPDCSSIHLEFGEEQIRCSGCGVTYARQYGTLLFARPASQICSRLEETFFTHPYGDDANALIRKYRRGVVLDYGAGHTHPERQHPHVVLHEAVHYDTVDVVSLTSRLPYRDNCFDAIISQAVFEHVPRPWEVAAELHRILKPGGEIHIDTAFMQPYHSDPYHFFNMTISGLREIFRPFREVRTGVKPYQLPSFGYRMQLEVMLNHMEPGVWHDRMSALLRDLQADGTGFDESLDANGRLYLAAGVYFHGTK